MCASWVWVGDRVEPGFYSESTGRCSSLACRAFKAGASLYRAPITSSPIATSWPSAMLCSGERAEVSAEQSVVFGVAPDPEPDEPVVHLDGQGAVELRRGVMSQRGVVLPAAWSWRASSASRSSFPAWMS